MKNFVRFIQQAHEERFSVVINNIIKRKLPVAFLSNAPIARGIQLVNERRAQGLNITRLITLDNNPPPQST